MDKLRAYRDKRDPARTPEPVPAGTPDSENPGGDTFVIQEHHARRLHWDFRLERDGVLVSWALPKGVPVDPAVNHLAVHTEDHPLEYGGFEGEIPKGEYGAGAVTIWDHGTYELEKWTPREVKVQLHGERVSGGFAPAYEGGVAIQAQATSYLRVIGLLEWNVGYLGGSLTPGDAAPDAGGAVTVETDGERLLVSQAAGSSLHRGDGAGIWTP